MTNPKDILNVEEALAELSLLGVTADSETSRVTALRTLLDRIAPKESDEERKREADEHAAALDEARGLLAELTAWRLASFCEPDTLAETGAPATTDAAPDA